MFAIAVELLAGRYTATQFNDRTEPEWPPHPARLFSAMVAAWADHDPVDNVERDALGWLEQQDPPSICCSEARRRNVVTHFVPVNDATALTRDISRDYALVTEAHSMVREAEQSGDGRALRRARGALAKATAKTIADGASAGRLGGRETSSMMAVARQVLPEYRSKQGRTYPTVIPDHATVWFIWPQVTPSGECHRALDRILGRIARLGHSSTLVACRCGTSAPRPAWTPASTGAELRLRVPGPGLVDRLERAFESHQASEPRTLPAGMIGYRRAREPQPVPSVPLLGGDWYILGISGQRPPSAVQILAIARATRNALLTHGDQPPPEFVSGHQRSLNDADHPTPPLERPHLAVVPLPSVGSAHSDGAIFGIGLVLPSHCSDEDRRATERALSGWYAAGFELLLPGGPGGQAARLTLDDYGLERATFGQPAWLDAAVPSRRRTTTRGYWCRPARRWLTATPIALDRFPGNLRSANTASRDRAEAEARESVSRACVFAGLVDDPAHVTVTIRLDSPLAGVPAAPSGSRRRANYRYPAYRAGSGAPRACVHAEIEFNQPVRGPVLIGAGRYFGYGLCLPMSGDGR